MRKPGSVPDMVDTAYIGYQSSDAKKKRITKMDNVIYEKRHKIAYVKLNRPNALNALDDDINKEL